MNLNHMIKELEKKYPLSAAVEWDNPGLQAGRRDKEIKKVLLALDATFPVIQEAKEWGADLLLTHHPLFMSGIKKVNTDQLLGRKAVELIQADISHYAMHTNFDVVTMAPLSADILGLEQTEILAPLFVDENGKEQGFGRVGNLASPMSLGELSELVKEKFALDTVKIFGDPECPVERAAISPGSGKSMIKATLAKEASVLISGDFGHHEGLDAMDEGLLIVDAGHYGLEHIFMDYMASFLKQRFPEVEVKKADTRNPFSVL